MIKLFKAEDRNIFEEEYLIINSLINESESNSFEFFDDISVNENGKYIRKVFTGGYLLLLPLLNDIRLDLDGFKWRIEFNQVFLYYLEENKSFSVEGAAGTSFSNFIAVFILKEKITLNNVLFPIESIYQNRLKKIVKTDYINVYLGRYDLSKTDVLPLKKLDRNWIVSPIEGMFNIQDRFLEAKEVMEIREKQLQSFESLSTSSMLLVIEH